MDTTRTAAYGDPLSAPFWEAAERHELVIQRCAVCEEYQFYPRPYCLRCQSDRVEWVATHGTGTIYSQTEVHLQIAPEFVTPYVVALVELDEGVRFLGTIISGMSRIGDRVRVVWRDREDAPPLPVFALFE